jgi:hypothetical protein
MGGSFLWFLPEYGGDQKKGFFMKNFGKLFGIIALVAVMVTVTGCVTATTIGGTADPHGLFSGGGAAEAVSAGATEIASYTVILGAFDSGYADYAATVKAAAAEGKKITTVTKNILNFVFTITAYAE